MRLDHQTILQYVHDHGPCSCQEIVLGTGLRHDLVYRFLYKARCYGNGKKWIDNIKQIPPLGNPRYGIANFTEPGQYTITTTGQQLLNAQNSNLPQRR